MKRIAIVALKDLSPDGGVGGVQAVTFWLAEALAPRADVTIFHPEEKIDLREVDRFYGTGLSKHDLHFRELPRYSFLSKFYLLRRSLRLKALARSLRKETYDVIISSDKEMDLGRPLVQYIHQPTLDMFYTVKPKNWWRRCYHFACFLIAGQSLESLRRNLTITNSLFSAKALRDNYHLQAEIVYPPLIVGEEGRPGWNERTNDFAIMSRLSPEKNIESLIEIVRTVRMSYPDTKLHIIGSAKENAYGCQIRQLMERHRDWVTYHGPLNKDRAAEVISRCRYGLSGMVGEPFGLAVAETAAWGCLPFVPASGGQTEIIAGDARLTFNDPAEAVQKILLLMADPAEQMELRKKIKDRLDQFKSSAFVAKIGQLVDNFPGQAN